MANPINLTASKLFGFTPACQAVTKKPAGNGSKTGTGGKA